MSHMMETAALAAALSIWCGYLCVRFAPQMRVGFRALTERAKSTPARTVIGMLLVGVAVAYAGNKRINTLVFDYNDGKGTKTYQRYALPATESDKFNLQAADKNLFPAGCSLAGWSHEKNWCSDMWADAESVLINAGPTTTVYAVWADKDCYVVSYNPGNGKCENSCYQQIKTNEVVNLWSTDHAAKIGFSYKKDINLLGWKNDEDEKRFDPGILAFNLCGSTNQVYELQAIWAEDDE